MVHHRPEFRGVLLPELSLFSVNLLSTLWDNRLTLKSPEGLREGKILNPEKQLASLMVNSFCAWGPSTNRG